MIFLISLPSCYLLGGIPIGFLIAKYIKGIDLREHGSKNIGATNVGRVIGWKYGSIALILDALKGALPVLFAHYTESPFALSTTQLVLGSMAIVGHTFTPYLNFKGGKGVATALGVYLTLVPFVTLCAVLIFLIVYKISGFVSLGSIIASFSMPIWYLGFVIFYSGTEFSSIILIVLIATFFLITFSHRENIKRMLQGKELKAASR